MMALGLSLTFHPLKSSAAGNVASSSVVVPSDSVAVVGYINRLNEIKDMDKSNLSSAEKRELRKEVKSLKREIRSNSRGIYISIGAAIIIVLLLILIL